MRADHYLCCRKVRSILDKDNFRFLTYVSRMRSSPVIFRRRCRVPLYP